jgi:hypothetical protein
MGAQGRYDNETMTLEVKVDEERYAELLEAEALLKLLLDAELEFVTQIDKSGLRYYSACADSRRAGKPDWIASVPCLSRRAALINFAQMNGIPDAGERPMRRS